MVSTRTLAALPILPSGNQLPAILVSVHPIDLLDLVRNIDHLKVTKNFFYNIRENPNSTFPLITEIFGEITLNFRGLSQITALSKLRQITWSWYGS